MQKRKFWIAIGFLMSFALWTGAVRFIDVQAIGPRESAVGFAALNGFVHSLTGVHMTLYTNTNGTIPPVTAVYYKTVIGADDTNSIAIGPDMVETAANTSAVTFINQCTCRVIQYQACRASGDTAVCKCVITTVIDYTNIVGVINNAV